MKVTVELTGNPSTGYLWEPDIEADDRSYASRGPEVSEDGGIIFGGQAFSVFVFNDVPPDTTITFNYMRPWEKSDEPLQVVRVHTATKNE